MLWCLIIIVVNLLLYLPTLYYGLVIDDIEQYKYWSSRKSVPWKKLFRPRVLKKYLYGAGSFTSNTTIDHAITLALHTVSAILICFAFNPITAILFSVHPVNHQTSIWLTGRRYSLLTIILLLSILSHSTPYILPPVFIAVVLHFYHARLSRQLLPSIPPHPITTLRSIGLSTLKIIGLITPAFLYPHLELGRNDYRNIDHLFYIGSASSLALIITGHPVILLSILISANTVLPHHQHSAERYLVLPALFIWTLLPPTIILMCLPLLIYRTAQLMPLYKNIQHFYSYHSSSYPSLKKLSLLRKLYPQIVI